MTTTTATAPHRRRIFCTSYSNIHRKNADCDAPQPPGPSRSPPQLAKIAGMPDIDPYPRTALNLCRTAGELLANAIVKDQHGQPAAGAACRQLATIRLQQAAELDPDSSDYYTRRIKAVEQEMKECPHLRPAARPNGGRTSAHWPTPGDFH